MRRGLWDKQEKLVLFGRSWGKEAPRMTLAFWLLVVTDKEVENSWGATI